MDVRLEIDDSVIVSLPWRGNPIRIARLTWRLEPLSVEKHTN